MPLREDILAPIAGENPSGIDLRYDPRLEKIKEARRQDDELAQGEWQTERKVANWPQLVKLAQDALATASKDIEVAGYLIEGLVQTERFAGLRQGLDFSLQMLAQFWDTLYPIIEDGDLEARSGRLEWIGKKLAIPVKSVPLSNAGYSYLLYQQSREVGYEDQAKTDKEKKVRSTAIDAGKLAPEVFDKSFAETPKAFYAQAEKELDASLELLKQLDSFCDEKMGSDNPGFLDLRKAITDVRLIVHQLLDKKREKEPDPIEVVAEEAPAAGAESAGEESDGAAGGALGGGLQVALTAEPADRRQAVAALVGAAAFLRKKEPFSPAPYLLIRGLRWGELRSAKSLADSPLLEAPPTEVRQQIKRLAIAKKWAELLEAGEQAMGLSGSRAWLDLQRLSVTACTALGDDYKLIASAITSELRALLNDLPELLDATLLDDTPAANPDTRAWLESLGKSVASKEPAVEEDAADGLPHAHRNGAPRWLAPALDAYSLAKDALASGQEEKAFTIMRKEVAHERSGRRRFRRTMQMIELAIAAGKDEIAQPLLEDVATAIEEHKLDTWEDPEQMAIDLTKLLKHSKKIQGSSSEKQKLFDRICRLDPVRVLNAG
jgi:type VI secretion system protein ImpA